MNNNADDQNEISNENLKPCPDKKLHHFDQEWANYANNPSPHFTPSQFFNAPHQHLPPLNLEKSYDDGQDKQGKKNPFRKYSAHDPQQDVNEEEPKQNYPYYPPFYQPYPMKYPPHPSQIFMHQYPHPIPYWYRPPIYYPQYDGQHYQNTLSKELQSKVSQLVQYQKVSPFACNCKKSKCLKLYCECFANNWVCSQNCNCCECKNRIDNPNERSKAIEEALLRNPDAFAAILTNNGQQPQIIQEEKSQKESQKDITTRKGCNCKKSECKKKYCECYSINQRCTDLCKCENCLNKVQSQEDSIDQLQKQENPKKESLNQLLQAQEMKVDQKDSINKKSKAIKKKTNKIVDPNQEHISESEHPIVKVKLTITEKQKKRKQ
ncbi:unnamed protein product [Paramecium pentaurelia]|uniref:CRC domain-containing protein n=1 Tax=Paramecium pentaurelia TaxID=43138 RepID=A0A8S1US87_9CILI|nr:unnamed protein product [Paramecium pentaurelia]